MADEIVIRIEDVGFDEAKAEALPTSPFRDDSPKATMESLFGKEPWWLKPEFTALNERAYTQEPITYPNRQPNAVSEQTSSSPNMLVEGCECAPYFEHIINILGGIYSAIVTRPNAQQAPNEQANQGNNQSDTLNTFLNQMRAVIAATSVANFVNNPVDATADFIEVTGNALATGINTLFNSDVVQAGLTLAFGPIGTVAGEIIGESLSVAIQFVFTTVAEGIRNLFAYADRMFSEITPFSGDAIGAQVSRQMSMLQFRMNTGANYGKQFADLYNAQTDLNMQLERIKLELFAFFGPLATDAVKVLNDIISTIKAVASEIDFSALKAFFSALTGGDFGGGFWIGLINAVLASPLLRAFAQPLIDIYNEMVKQRLIREEELRQAQGFANRNVAQFFGWITP